MVRRQRAEDRLRRSLDRTEAFNATLSAHRGAPTRATFDARVFTIPDPVEVENYLVWRQKDTIRNSISGLAHCHFSVQQVHGVTQEALLFALAVAGVRWD